MGEGVRMDTALERLQFITGLPNDKLDMARSDLRIQTVAAGQHFAEAGQPCGTIGFVLRGIFRFYYLTFDGQDMTKSFCSENEFVGVYSAFLQNLPAAYSIEALEPGELLVFSFRTLQKLSQQDPVWLQLRLQMVEQLYLKKEQREQQLLLYDAKIRYQNFLNAYPNLEKRLKQYHVASYLGITPVSLSRIRAQLGLTDAH